MVIVDAVMGVVRPLLDKWIPDAKDRLQAENMLVTNLHAINLAQIEVNKQEAASSSLFVAGWRPFVGWVCGASFAYAVILNDFFNWIAAVRGLPAFPEPDTTLTLEILMGLLGMASLRSYEKYKGVAK
jgi:hypothetical protein